MDKNTSKWKTLQTLPDGGRVSVLSSGETVQECEYKRLYLKANAERDELLSRVNNLRKAWIAPHRFNTRSAEVALVEYASTLDLNR